MAEETAKIPIYKAMKDNEDSEAPAQSVRQRVKHFSTAFMKRSYNGTGASSSEKVRRNTQRSSSGGSTSSTSESHAVSQVASLTDETQVRGLEEMRGQSDGSVYSCDYSKPSRNAGRQPPVTPTTEKTKKPNNSLCRPVHKPTARMTTTTHHECSSALLSSSSVKDLSNKCTATKSLDTLKMCNQRGLTHLNAAIEINKPIDQPYTYGNVCQIREIFSPKRVHDHTQPRAKSVQHRPNSNLSARWPVERLADTMQGSDYSPHWLAHERTATNTTITQLGFCPTRLSPRPANDVICKCTVTKSLIPPATTTLASLADARCLIRSNSATEIEKEIASLQAQRNVRHIRELFLRKEVFHRAKQRAESAHHFPSGNQSVSNTKNNTDANGEFNKDSARGRGRTGEDFFRVTDDMREVTPLVRCQVRSRTTESRRRQAITMACEDTVVVRWRNATDEMEAKKNGLKALLAKEMLAIQLVDTLEDDNAGVEVRSESAEEKLESRRCCHSESRKHPKQSNPLTQYSKYWLITCWLAWVGSVQNRASDTIQTKENALNRVVKEGVNAPRLQDAIQTKENALNRVVKEGVNAPRLQCVFKADTRCPNSVHASRVMSPDTSESNVLLKCAAEKPCAASVDTACWKPPLPLTYAEKETVVRPVDSAQPHCVMVVAHPCKSTDANNNLEKRAITEKTDMENADSSDQWLHRVKNLNRRGLGTSSSIGTALASADIPKSPRATFQSQSQKASAPTSAACAPQARLGVRCKTAVPAQSQYVKSSDAMGDADSSDQWCHRTAAHLRSGSGTANSTDTTKALTNTSSSRATFFVPSQKVSGDESATCASVARRAVRCKTTATLQEPNHGEDNFDAMVDADPSDAWFHCTCQDQEAQRNLNNARVVKGLSKIMCADEALSNWRKDVATGDKRLRREDHVIGKHQHRVFEALSPSFPSKPSSNEQLDTPRSPGEFKARMATAAKGHKQWFSTSPSFDKAMESVDVKDKIDQYSRNRTLNTGSLKLYVSPGDVLLEDHDYGNLAEPFIMVAPRKEIRQNTMPAKPHEALHTQGIRRRDAGRSLSPNEFMHQDSSGSARYLDNINDLHTYVGKRSERMELHRPLPLADSDNLAFRNLAPSNSEPSSTATLWPPSKLSPNDPDLQARIQGAGVRPRKAKSTSTGGQQSPEARMSNRSMRIRAIAVVKTTLGKYAKSHRVSTSARTNAFRRFIDADTVASVVSSFNKLVVCFASNPRVKDGNKFPFQRIEALKGLPWKARDVWKNLAKQLQPPKLKGYKIIVVGAGPCGLRAALCAASYGAEVVVLEKREEFVRKNRLHIWECVKADVVDWNGKIFSPPGPQFGMDQDYTHIGIAELQLLLLKNCFLLGVELKTNMMCAGVTPKSDNRCGWIIDTSEGKMECDVVIGADGPESKFSKLVPGLSGSVSLELKNAIGLVVNFVNKDSVKSRLRQFSWSKQFNEKMFADLEHNAGADLENIVYYRGPDTHYFVMTPTAQTIQLNHICDQLPIGPRSVINYANLRSFARKITVHLGFSKRLRFLGDDTAESGALRQDCMLFDFSSTRRATDSVVFTGGNGAPAALVGDALLEPFWPEGLGIIRGFFSVLDVCHAIATWAEHGQKVAERDATQAWTSLKSLNAHNRVHIVREQLKEYGTNPRTRYRGFV